MKRDDGEKQTNAIYIEKYNFLSHNKHNYTHKMVVPSFSANIRVEERGWLRQQQSYWTRERKSTFLFHSHVLHMVSVHELVLVPQPWLIYIMLSYVFFLWNIFIKPQHTDTHIEQNQNQLQCLRIDIVIHIARTLFRIYSIYISYTCISLNSQL